MACGQWAAVEAVVQVDDRLGHLERVLRPAGVDEGPLELPLHHAEAAPARLAVRQQLPRLGEGEVVVERFEPGDQVLDLAGNPVAPNSCSSAPVGSPGSNDAARS